LFTRPLALKSVSPRNHYSSHFSHDFIFLNNQATDCGADLQSTPY